MLNSHLDSYYNFIDSLLNEVKKVTATDNLLQQFRETQLLMVSNFDILFNETLVSDVSVIWELQHFGKYLGPLHLSVFCVFLSCVA